MKEINSTQSSIEVTVKQKKEIKKVLKYKIVPKNGHTIFKINNESFVIEKAKFSNVTYQFGQSNQKKEIMIEEGFTYISALNKKNALRKYVQLTT